MIPSNQNPLPSKPQSATKLTFTNALSRLSSICLRARRKLSKAEVSRQIWKEICSKDENQSLPSLFSLLINLYDGKDVYEALETSRINFDYTLGQHMRNDLEYYIPQLTNFLIYHQDFENERLNTFLQKACNIDPFLAHSYYWYIMSLESDLNQQKIKDIVDHIMMVCPQNENNNLFLEDYQKFYSILESKLNAQDYQAKIAKLNNRKQKLISWHLEEEESYKKGQFTLKASDIELKLYTSPFDYNKITSSNPFTSTILFFQDLTFVAEEIDKTDDKLTSLKSLLHEINSSLPSCVYLPFIKNYLRYHAVLNIVVDETRVFSTKTRAPFELCIELFRPQEELGHQLCEIFETKNEKSHPKLLAWAKARLRFHHLHSSPFREHPKDLKKCTALDQTFNLNRLNAQASAPKSLKSFPDIPKIATSPDQKDRQVEDKEQDLGQKDSKESQFPLQKLHLLPCGSVRMDSPDQQKACSRDLTLDRKRSTSLHDQLVKKREFLYKFKEDIVNDIQKPHKDSEKEEKIQEEIQEEDEEFSGNEAPKEKFSEPENEKQEMAEGYFGEDSEEQAKRIREKSAYKDLKSWRLMHFVVKSGADIKEEQFAIQLVSQFDQIFKSEKLDLILTPYEIISIGPNIGILEMIKDSVPFCKLKEKLYEKNITSLNDFFISYFGKDIGEARKRFCRSLVAYSLLCYFLQIKDRHNGNILLHKKGHIIHIDYGFFLSNAPGKGIEFEKNVPFKLLNEYVEVLGGYRSRLFQEFRRLFYRGFMAARKHSQQIIILVKMMYSSHGHNLPCFKAGEKAITELEERFFPPGVSERELPKYCYNLINENLDNWRSKYYDKYQYYVEGIFY